MRSSLRRSTLRPYGLWHSETYKTRDFKFSAELDLSHNILGQNFGIWNALCDIKSKETLLFMHYSPIARDFSTNRELFLPKRVHLASIDAPKPLNCAILHGWHSLYAPLVGLENALRALPSGQNVRFWRVTYDTHWKSFGQSAREISFSLRKQGVVPENTLLVGYSMGGVVSRAMIAEGFDAAGALCLCSPHLGPAPWMPSGDIGSLSIAPWGAKLARLNRHPRDAKKRSDYFFQAFTFKDRNGEQLHDRIVTQKSALALILGDQITRNSHELNYPGIAPGCDPHLHGMAPNFLPEALAWCEQKFAAMENRLIPA